MLDADQIVSQIRSELESKSTPEGIRRFKRFFKEEISCYGLMSAQIEEIVKKYYPFIEGDMNLALKVGERLFQSEFMEEASVATVFMNKMSRKFRTEHFEIFDCWVDYLTNWGDTDGFSLYIIGRFVLADDSRVKRLMEWTRSQNRWRRRAAAVSMIPAARKGLLLGEIFHISEHLMLDGDEMVQKGVGWLLKETSKKNPEEVHEFLIHWKDEAPALILRYASEKLPENMRVLKSH
jgi:3-methyladenine DNA glycosylase AlkD